MISEHAFIWILSHLLFVIYILKLGPYIRLLINSIVIVLLLYIYFTKPLTYDLVVYNSALESGIIYEQDVGFILLQYIVLHLPVENKVSVISGILGILIIVTAILISKQKNIVSILQVIAVILGSIYFLLATQNVLRQGFSSLFLIISIILLFKNRLASLLFFVISYSFHASAYIFYILIIFAYFVQSRIFDLKLYFMTMKFIKYFRDKKLRFSYGFVFSILLLIFVVVSFLGYHFIRYTKYSHYLDFVLTENRLLPAQKIIFIAISFIFTEILLSKSNKYSKQNETFAQLRLLRLNLFVFLLALLPYSGLAEAWSRILFFYFCIEAFLLITLKLQNVYDRLFFTFTITSYGIYLNALSILSYY